MHPHNDVQLVVLVTLHDIVNSEVFTALHVFQVILVYMVLTNILVLIIDKDSFKSSLM